MKPEAIKVEFDEVPISASIWTDWKDWRFKKSS